MPTHVLTDILPIEQTVKANILEADCIGCVKCISACPFDAILGSNQLMHTVIESACTGCALCVPACPVDCIVLVPTDSPCDSEQATKRFYAKQKREQLSGKIAEENYNALTQKQTKDPTTERLRIIQAAREREKQKKDSL